MLLSIIVSDSRGSSQPGPFFYHQFIITIKRRKATHSNEHACSSYIHSYGGIHLFSFSGVGGLMAMLFQLTSLIQC